MIICLNYRYRDTEDELNLKEQESKNLEKLKKTIEERKKSNRDDQKSGYHQDKITETKDNQLQSSNSVTVVDEQCSQTVLVSQDVNVCEERKNIEKPEFKVLGGKDFEKKAKVSGFYN